MAVPLRILYKIEVKFMKTKKFISAVCSAVLCCSFAVTAFAGCKKECEHVYNWTVQTESTCSADGVRNGVCGICSDVITEAIPVNPEAHAYGDWEVQVPTDAAKGKAVKTCTLNASHKTETELPVLTDGKYTVEIKSPSTVTQEGSAEYTYPHDLGDITFTVGLPKKEITELSDAVTLAVENKGEIGKTAGTMVMPVSGKPATNNFYYEFGDDFTHIISDGDSREFYCTDDGDFYAVEISNVKYNYDGKGYPTDKKTAGSDPAQSSINAGYIDGIMLALGYTGTPGAYGAEDFLSVLFEIADENRNGDFVETELNVKDDGTVDGGFTFGYFMDSSQRFSTITVKFNLNDTLSLKNLNVESKIYGIESIDGEGNPVYGYVQDEETGYYSVKSDSSPVGIESVSLKQERKSELETPVADNPYPKNALLVKYFDLTYKTQDGQTLTVGEETVEFSAGAPVVFSIVNVENVAENINKISYDPIEAFLRDDGKDIPLTASTGTDNKINVSAVTNNSTATIRCFRMGEVTVVLKTRSRNYEKVIKINVGNPQPPSMLLSEVYHYYDTGYEWVTTNKDDFKIYVGQSLEFRAKAPEAEESYTDVSYTASVSDAMQGASVADADISTNNMFTASKPGRYELTLISTLDSKIKTYLYIIVEEAPTAELLFGRDYYAQLEDPERVKADIKFTPADAVSGTVTVSFLGMTETLSYEFTPASIVTANGNRVYNNPRLVTRRVSGAELGCSLSINDAYGITLSHAKEISGQFEEVVIIPVKA